MHERELEPILEERLKVGQILVNVARCPANDLAPITDERVLERDVHPAAFAEMCSDGPPIRPQHSVSATNQIGDRIGHRVHRVRVSAIGSARSAERHIGARASAG